MKEMFYHSKFNNRNGDISKWSIRSRTNMERMFKGSPIENNQPNFY